MQMKMKCSQFGHMGAVQLCCQQLWWVWGRKTDLGLIWFGLTESILMLLELFGGQKTLVLKACSINYALTFPSRVSEQSW